MLNLSKIVTSLDTILVSSLAQVNKSSIATEVRDNVYVRTIPREPFPKESLKEIITVRQIERKIKDRKVVFNVVH